VLNTVNGTRKLDLGINLIELVTSVGLQALRTVDARSVNKVSLSSNCVYP